MAVITGAGRGAGTKKADPKTLRKELVREIARRMRAAKDDDEYTDAVEAMMELAATPEE